MKTIFTPKTLVVLLFTLVLNVALAQEQNALDFDGAGDRVEVPNASAALANGIAISLSMWVYPTNTNIVFPDYDGFAGFRNNSTADFYMVQFGNNKLEARFRNSNGVAFDVVDTVMPVNVWVHYTLTYSGSELTLYRNGSLVQSIPANGSIASPSETFYVGYLPYLTYDYYLTGKADEVALWSRALSGNEVSCVASESVNPTDPGLVLYYDFNQGTAGGINSSITTLNDISGTTNGTLTGFSMFGNTSNFVAGVQNYTSLSQTICPGSSVTMAGQTFSTAGQYTVRYPMSTSCDSVTSLLLSIADTSITELFADGITLQSNENSVGAQYAWADCNNGYALISGQTTNMFTPTVPGDYALILTVGGCSDTSACHNVIYTGISSPSNNSFFALGANPFHNELSIQVGAESSKISVTDVSGRVVYAGFARGSEKLSINSEKWASGVYFVRAVNALGVASGRIVKE